MCAGGACAQVDVEPAAWFAWGNRQASQEVQAAWVNPLAEEWLLLEQWRLAPPLRLSWLAVLASEGVSPQVVQQMDASDDRCCVLPGQAPAELWARCLRAGLVEEYRVRSRWVQPLNLLHCLYYRQGEEHLAIPYAPQWVFLS